MTISERADAPKNQAEELLGAVARGWCHPTNSSKVFDPDLAIAIAAEVSALRSEIRPSRNDVLEEAVKEIERQAEYFPFSSTVQETKYIRAVRALKTNAAGKVSSHKDTDKAGGAVNPSPAAPDADPQGSTSEGAVQPLPVDRSAAPAVPCVVVAHADRLRIIARVCDQYLHLDYGKQLNEVADAIERQCERREQEEKS